MSSIIAITQPRRASAASLEDWDNDLMSLSDSNLSGGEDHEDEGYIRLPKDVKAGGALDRNSSAAGHAIVTPGELVTSDPVWMRGHGTYSVDDNTYSAVAGVITRVNKLISVVPLRGRYVAEIGDHVVGRITEVGQRRWKVDIGARQDAILMLGSVNLPGGVLRRKSESDELQMRAFLKEGDLLNAEVQSIFSDGAASLHTRSLKYGKLRNGYFLSVPPSLIIRSKIHTHLLPGGIDLLLGVNGYIWLSKHILDPSASTNDTLNSDNPIAAPSISITRLEQVAGWSIYSDQNEEISVRIRQTISRYTNCIRSLAHSEVGINEMRIVAAYEASTVYENTCDLLEPSVQDSLVKEVLATER